MREFQHRVPELIASQEQSTRFAVGSIELPGLDVPDFQTLFRHMPGIFIATRPDFTIVAASDDMRRKTFTWRDEIIGRSILDVFPDNSSGDEPGGTTRLEAWLRDVLESGATHSAHVVRYDIRDRLSGDDGWVEKFWTVVSRPVVDRQNGEVLYVLTEAHDLTRVVQLALWLKSRGKLAPEMHRSVQRMRRDVLDREPDLSRVRARIQAEMALTGATPEVLVGELTALLRSPESRLYACAGEWAPESGVYVAYHRKGCVSVPRARYFAEGAMLPSCHRCGNDVLYRLSHGPST
jgi:hypothetical protein